MTIEHVNIPQNTIDLWLCKPSLITDTQLLDRYHALLDEEEAQKVARLKFQKHRKDALITRAFVREVLGRYTNLPPKQLCFKKGEKGKPYITNSNSPLFFNLSHTQNLIICGVNSSSEIGVDVENLHRNNDSIIDIADRYFSKTEVEALNKLPENQKKSRFFDYWTLKESFIKVVGLGLSFPLDEFSFVIGEQNNSVTEKDKGTHKKGSHERPLCNSNIRLSVDAKRAEQGEDYLSWLLYPTEQHRIAITVENKKQLAEPEFSMRFFETVPLEDFRKTALLEEGI